MLLSHMTIYRRLTVGRSLMNDHVLFDPRTLTYLKSADRAHDRCAG